MPDPRLGTPVGLTRRGTIRAYNADGTVTIALDEAALTSNRLEFKAPIPMAWTGQEGEFLGGFPRTGASVAVAQGMGGEWYVTSYLPSEGLFGNANGLTKSSYQGQRLEVLKPNRLVGQVKDGSRFFLDPEIGFQVGRPANFWQANPKANILSHNFATSLEFTAAGRTVDNLVRRDLSENSSRNITSSTLDSQAYENSLFSIGLDPTLSSTLVTTGSQLRNPALTERRHLAYEFAYDSKFSTDSEESLKYVDAAGVATQPRLSRREMRGDALSLSLEYPNHLLETVTGTVVDLFGNVVDLNRSILPLGKSNELSLKNNSNKSEAFNNLREQLRKSIAYHFEINTRKPGLETPDPSDRSDFARDRSRFFVDIDKEGLIKLNVPASSETGNVPLLTRTENYSVLLSKQDTSIHPNAFIRPSNNQDLYLENFGANTQISLKDSDGGATGPIDRFTDQPMKFGTAFHDITKTCGEFLTSANYLAAGMKLINFDPDNRLNKTWTPLTSVVSDSIITSGPKANAGGRSILGNFDGMAVLNIGANTVDRQSLWIDLAGSMVARHGRDLRNISYAGQMDGDVFLQIGGPGLGNTQDSRFASANDAYRNGALDIRVLCNGQMNIIRIDQNGISIASPGTLTLSAQQDVIIKSNSNLLLDAENIVMYAGSSRRIVNRMPANSI